MMGLSDSAADSTHFLARGSIHGYGTPLSAVKCPHSRYWPNNYLTVGNRFLNSTCLLVFKMSLMIELEMARELTTQKRHEFAEFLKAFSVSKLYSETKLLFRTAGIWWNFERRHNYDRLIDTRQANSGSPLQDVQRMFKPEVQVTARTYLVEATCFCQSRSIAIRRSLYHTASPC